jgi:IMP dehydrogenase/GMP reductase
VKQCISDIKEREEMANQASNGWLVPGRNSSTGAAVLDRPGIAALMTHAGDRLQEQALRLPETSRAGRPSGRRTTGQFGENNRQLRILAQIGAGKVEELITQTYIGDHEKMKLAVDNVAVALQALQKEMARLTETSQEGQLAERGKPGRFQGASKLKDRLVLVLDTERTVDLPVEMTA